MKVTKVEKTERDDAEVQRKRQALTRRKETKKLKLVIKRETGNKGMRCFEKCGERTIVITMGREQMAAP